jgi:hypothetical protein
VFTSTTTSRRGDTTTTRGATAIGDTITRTGTTACRAAPAGRCKARVCTLLDA